MVDTIVSVFILIALGYLARRVGLLEKKDSRALNNLIIYITLPALIFRSVRASAFSYRFLEIPLVALAVMAATLGFSWLWAVWASSDKRSTGAALLAAAAGNTGYLGYPLTEKVIGRPFVAYAVYYDLFGTVLFLFTAGLLICERYGERHYEYRKVKEILTFPPLIALAASYALGGLSFPGYLNAVINMLAEATIPLIMFSIGLALEGVRLGREMPLALGAGLSKLAVSPALALVLVLALGLPPAVGRVGVLEASMPTAMLSFILGERYGLDTTLLSSLVVITTVVSMATIPAWQWLIVVLS